MQRYDLIKPLWRYLKQRRHDHLPRESDFIRATIQVLGPKTARADCKTAAHGLLGIMQRSLPRNSTGLSMTYPPVFPRCNDLLISRTSSSIAHLYGDSSHIGTPSSTVVKSLDPTISFSRAFNSSTSQLTHTNLPLKKRASREASQTQK